MNKHQIYMDIAKNYSNFSKCTFTQVGAIAINENGRIIATGVNGTIPGMQNCQDHHFENRDDHVSYTEEHEIHAEENIILEMATNSMRFNSVSIYVTLSPCKTCLKHLLGLTREHLTNKIRIDKIVYNQRYHRTTDEELNSMKSRAAKVGCELILLDDLLSRDKLQG